MLFGWSFRSTFSFLLALYELIKMLNQAALGRLVKHLNFDSVDGYFRTFYADIFAVYFVKFH